MLRYLLSFCIVSVFTFILSGCAKKSEQELLNSARKNIKEGKVTEAIADYESLAKAYPQSPEAPKSLFEIAKLYHSKNVKNVYPDESLKKGILYYRRIYNQYPKSEEAPKALFMIGFIQSNDLGRFDSATVSYKLFLEKYPNNEMASSARAELDNMGLTPQEIIKKNMEVKK